MLIVLKISNINIIKNEKLAGFRIRLSQRGIQGIRTGGGEEDISLRLQGSDLKKLKLIADDIKEKIDLFNLFQKYGEIERCRVLTNIVEGKVASKCCGFVRYKDIKSAMNAIKSLNVTYTNISMYPLQLEYSKSNRKENDYDISNQYNILKM